MPEQPSATRAVPPPLPGRTRTPIPTLGPAPQPAPAAPLLAPLAAPAAPLLTPTRSAAAVAIAPPSAAPTAQPAPAPAPSAPPASLYGLAASTSTALPSAEQAEAALAGALQGDPDLDPSWRAAAERVLAALSEGERAALSSGPLSFEPGLLRGAAGLRLRLDLAVALVPSCPDLHGTVLPALLGEVDDLLLKMKAAAAAAQPGAAEALDPVRLALVDGGVALAGALARVGPAVPVPPPAAPLAPSSRPAPRVLSNVTAAEAAASAAGRGGKGLWITLALVAAAAGGYHGWQYATRRPPALLPALAGAPAHTFVIRQGVSVVLNAEPGARVDPGELGRFTEQERIKGNVVRPIGTGMWAIEPAAGEGAKP